MPKNSPAGASWTALADHVAPYPSEATGYTSTFLAALTDARALTGRDPVSGDRTGTDPVALWAGSVVYLVLLEQIGKSLRPQGARKRVKGERKLEKALRQFASRGGGQKKERQVLYALRCAFAHEYGLMNFGFSNHRLHARVFVLDDDPSTQTLVKWPRQNWDGNVTSISKKRFTKVNLVVLGDLVEEVVRSIRSYSNSGKLKSEISELELQRRFVFVSTESY